MSTAILYVHFCIFLFQRWVRSFRKCFTIVVHTNNGVEAQNRAFKFQYVEPYRRKSLSNLLSCIVGSFLPDTLRKYVQSLECLECVHVLCKKHSLFKIVTMTHLKLQICFRGKIFLGQCALLVRLLATEA